MSVDTATPGFVWRPIDGGDTTTLKAPSGFVVTVGALGLVLGVVVAAGVVPAPGFAVAAKTSGLISPLASTASSSTLKLRFTFCLILIGI